jgi:L-arabinonolactonase
MADVECVLRIRGGGGPAGECPVWSAEEKRLYWIDIDGPSVNRFDPATGKNETCPLTEQIGSFALRERGGLLIATRSGFHFLDFGTGARRSICDPESHLPDNRMNDGRCDPHGRFWCGSMRDPQDPKVVAASLYRLGADLACTKMLDGLITANGLAFSPDGRTLYLSDSNVAVQTIWAFDFDVERGTIRNRRVFATTHELPGRPDGGCCDEEAFYWSAIVDGGLIARFAPDGRIERTIRTPVRSPSMMAFGGERLDVLYITSIRRGGAAKEWPDQPLAGSLFACEPGVRGLREPRFRG